MEGEECLTEVQRNLTKQPQTINVNDNKNGNKDLSERVQTVDSLANGGPPGPPGPPQEIKNLTNAEILGRCCLRVSPIFSKFSQRICDLSSGESRLRPKTTAERSAENIFYKYPSIIQKRNDREVNA